LRDTAVGFGAVKDFLCRYGTGPEEHSPSRGEGTQRLSQTFAKAALAAM
jgi:hypothetical protein